MSATRRRPVALAVGLLTLLLALVAWWWPSSPPPAPAAPLSQRVRSLPARPVPPSTPAPPPPAAPSPEPPLAPEAIAEALQAVFPEDVVLSCPAGDLPDGVYRARRLEDDAPVEARAPTVRDGILRLAVSSPSGAVLLGQYWQTVGKLSWSGAHAPGQGSCRVHPRQDTEVEGTVRWADGSPAEDLMVRGCPPSVLVRTDADGRFAFTARGSGPCHVFAFDLPEGGVAKGEVVTFDLEAGGTQVLDLQAPGDNDHYGPEQMDALAGILVHLSKDRIATLEGQLDALLPQAEAATGATQAVIHAWIDERERELDDIHARNELLYDEASRVEAVQQVFFE